MAWFVVLVAVSTLIPGYHAIESTPPHSKTVGQPWPMPQFYTVYGDSLLLSETFTFSTVGQSCDILGDALDRYYRLIFYGGNTGKADNTLHFINKQWHSNQNSLTSLEVNVAQPCVGVSPSLEMDESYELKVVAGTGSLAAKTIWGALRGLETFSQLIYENTNDQYVVNVTTIHDFPRFAWRGVLLDSSRHYLPKAAILQNLEAMAYNKMNVFHWHIVDDQSFPYQSRDYPQLSAQGAYDPHTHVYSQEDVKDIIEFARMRGIRVVPEFDSPGHSHSWGKGQKELLTKCYNHGTFDGGFGPIDPTLKSTYGFLKGFLKELSEVFPDKYLHLGGDEVSFSCWKSNPNITAFMQSQGYGKNYAKLEEYYMQNLLDIVNSYKKGYIIWQEVVDNGVKVSPNTVVEVWKGGYKDELEKVTRLGFHAVLSSCWYLNRISMGSDWKSHYKCDPHSFNGTQEQKSLVVGGELCMWGEYVDGTNVISRTWPRGSAVAERLWSSAKLVDPNKAATRLEEHRCRMVRRGLNAEPVNGPSYCKYEYQPDQGRT